jgi:hypothetical protein
VGTPVTSRGWVGYGGMGVEVAAPCAWTVKATEVAMTDSLEAELPHALSRMAAADRMEIKGKVRFIRVPFGTSCREMPALIIPPGNESLLR